MVLMFHFSFIRPAAEISCFFWVLMGGRLLPGGLSAHVGAELVSLEMMISHQLQHLHKLFWFGLWAEIQTTAG